MNRAKQLETLRGMKFMQRKEEEIRREVAEGGTETAMTTDASSSSAANLSTPVTTILLEDRFDPSSHNMGRRRFVQRAPQPPTVAANNEAFDESNLWSQTLPDISTSGNIVSMNEPLGGQESEGQDNGSSMQYRGNGRFTLKESVRAPPMPRRLEEAMSGKPDRKRGRVEGGKRTLNSYEGEEGSGDEDFEV